MLPIRTLVTISMATLLLTGCLGGGGGSSTVSSGTSPAPTPTPPPSGTSTVEISWDAPTTRSDGSCLGSDLGSFIVSYGEQSGSYSWNSHFDLNAGGLTCEL